MGKWPTIVVLFALSGVVALAEPAAPGEPVPAELRTVTPASLEALAAHFTHTPQRSYLSPHFVILHDTASWRARSHAVLLERTHAQFFEAFEEAGIELQPLTDRLVCMLFTRESDFGRYARWAEGMDLSWTGGYYSARTNRVALFERGWPRERPSADESDTADADADEQAKPPLRLTSLEPAASDDRLDGLASTIHEAAHQLAFNTGLQTRGVMYPFWVSEGIAISFETQRPSEPFGPAHVNLERLQDLRRAYETGQLMPLEQFVAMVRPPSDDPAMLPIAYAQAWALFHHLFTHQPKALREYLARLAALSPGRRTAWRMRSEFVTAFGSLESLEADWQAHLVMLVAEPDDTSAE